jgi:aminocarboxymuconate-semialdehyde decarboxylase
VSAPTPEGPAARRPAAESPAVDVHAHSVPRRLVDALRRGEAAFSGVAVEMTEAGAVLTFPGRPPLRPIAPELLDFTARLEWMEAHGIRCQLVSPWLDAQGSTLPPAAGLDWARFLNDLLAEAVRDGAGQNGGGRLVALATVHLGDGDGAARELERAVRRLGMPGAMVSTDPRPAELTDPSLDPLWAAAEELGAPVVLHPDFDGPSRCMGLGPGGANALGRLVDATLAAVRLILAGVLDRHPHLRLLLVHGGGFLPYQAGRVDRAYDIGSLGERRLRGPGPADYLRRFHYDTVLLRPAALELLVREVGAERVVLGSDYPFPIGDPDPLAGIAASGLDGVVREGVLHANAARLFGAAVASGGAGRA